MGRFAVLSLAFALVLASTVTFGAAAADIATRGGLPAIPLGKIGPGLWDTFFAIPAGQLEVLIETRSADYDGLVAEIESMGGRIVYEYKFVSGLAAVVPASRLLLLASNPEVMSIDPDALVTLNPALPGGILEADFEHLAGRAIPLDEDFQVLDVYPEAGGAFSPDTFVSTETHGAAPLIADGIDGSESIAAIIDTGIYSGHFMLRGKVVSGADVSPDVGTGFEGFDDVRNHWHGSAVAGVLGGFARIVISGGSLLARSIELHTGTTLPPGPVPGTKILTLSGIAPGTKFFVVKVFPHSGAGVSTSRVIRAMEVAMAAKASGRLDIDIISMSLGGATLFDGRGLDGKAVDRAVAMGIAVSIAAGNEGPAPMTVADPGASNAAITSAALVHPFNTRVSWDLFLGRLGIGRSLFVSDDPQIHAFSSRGPTADGRGKPDVAALGVDNLAPFPLVTNRGQGLAFVSGTSFATPSTSGVLSLLNDFIEGDRRMPDGATPEDLKQAVIAGARPIPGYSLEEQGAGFVNARAALDELAGAPLGKTPEDLREVRAGTPLEDLADIRNTLRSEAPDAARRMFTTELTLGPGENREFVFETVAGTDSITVRLDDVEVGTNPDPVAQAAFPNSFEVYIHDAKRGGSGAGFGYYVYSANVLDDATFTIRDGRTSISGRVSVFPEDVVHSVIEPGFSKVVVEGDWSNAVPVSGTLTIEVTFAQPSEADRTFAGSVVQFNFQTGAGLIVIGPLNLRRGAVLELSWSPGDYAHFPSSDVDMLIAKPGGAIVNARGATLNAPERTILGDGGQFFVLILGFEINPPGGTETFTLEIFDA